MFGLQNLPADSINIERNPYESILSSCLNITLKEITFKAFEFTILVFVYLFKEVF